jgi:hypothetical protein
MSKAGITFLVASIVALGCGASHSKPPSDGSPPSTGQGGNDGGVPRVITYTWRAEWGPCPPTSGPCYEQFVVTPDGAVAHDLQGVTASAQLIAADLSQFERFVDDASLGAAISGPACCQPSPDRTETVTLNLGSSAPPLSKNVVCCAGAEYDAIKQWTSTLETYFATPGGSDASSQ